MRGRFRQVLARALATALAATGDPRIPVLSLHGAHANFSAPACPVVGG